MFSGLTQKFQDLFSSLGREKKLTEENIKGAIRTVRLALLDADVNYRVASDFVKRVREKAVGSEVIAKTSAADSFTKIVHDELVSLMGGDEAALHLKSVPTVILLCGLQGAGKTTTAAKLGHFLKGKAFRKSPLLIAADLQRPAAIDQLAYLCEQNQLDAYVDKKSKSPLEVVKSGMAHAKHRGHDVVIIDTAGRLQIDEALMTELKAIKELTHPQEVLFVASCEMGQDAVNSALEFDKAIGTTGSILTMLDGSARAGAAISIREVTHKPLKFEGVGEKIEDLQLFNPSSMADRILGMGDVINLVKKAEEHLDDAESKRLEEKFIKAQFTYEDFLSQMGKIQKMGSMKSLLKMLPGVGAMPEVEGSDEEFSKLKAMIQSMTPKERKGLVEMEPSRKRRVSKGSGCELDDVHRLVKNFKQLKKMAKQMPKMKKKMRGLEGMDLASLAKQFKF